MTSSLRKVITRCGLIICTLTSSVLWNQTFAGEERGRADENADEMQAFLEQRVKTGRDWSERYIARGQLALYHGNAAAVEIESLLFATNNLSELKSEYAASGKSENVALRHYTFWRGRLAMDAVQSTNDSVIKVLASFYYPKGYESASAPTTGMLVRAIQRLEDPYAGSTHMGQDKWVVTKCSYTNGADRVVVRALGGNAGAKTVFVRRHDGKGFVWLPVEHEIDEMYD